MTQKTMAPEQFEKWLKSIVNREAKPNCGDTTPYAVAKEILSRFRTVKWENTCGGCLYTDQLLEICTKCKRGTPDHYTPRNEGKEIKP